MRIESAADVLLRHVAAGTFTGGVLAVGRGRDELDVVSLGRADLEGAPMSTESIFRIQSMTKASTRSSSSITASTPGTPGSGSPSRPRCTT